jgi:hypothetical protein
VSINGVPAASSIRPENKSAMLLVDANLQINHLAAWALLFLMLATCLKAAAACLACTLSACDSDLGEDH